MTRIRKVDIRHFRGIRHFIWLPTPGVNCLVGPGDCGKSTVLNAIDLCLGARRSFEFTDADFHKLDVDTEIRIAVTIGDLRPSLKNIELYGAYLRGFKAGDPKILPEPEQGAESVLTVLLRVGADLEPTWTLYSENAEAQGLTRNLSWDDRVRVAPTRLGSGGEYDLSWRRGSLLHKVSDEKANQSAVLAKAARAARNQLGTDARTQVKETLKIVSDVATAAGVPIGDVTALLDPVTASLSGSAISLHDGDGVPLRNLGLGSTRLIRAGLQREAADEAAIMLADEIEHGLEPHRLIRLIASVGARERDPPLQVLMTTHSPVTICELSARQLFILRMKGTDHVALPVNDYNVQGAVRRCPEALLAESVIICEGATEVGFIRGLDNCRVKDGKPSVAALGAALPDGQGDSMYERAGAIAKLGFRTLLLRDDDNPPDGKRKAAYQGKEIVWRNQQALEQELFSSLSDQAVLGLLEQAVGNKGVRHVDENITSASNGQLRLAGCRSEVTAQTRATLGLAAKTGDWFKRIDLMERAATEVVGPDLPNWDAGFKALIDDLFAWVENGRSG